MKDEEEEHFLGPFFDGYISDDESEHDDSIYFSAESLQSPVIEEIDYAESNSSGSVLAKELSFMQYSFDTLPLRQCTPIKELSQSSSMTACFPITPVQRVYFQDSDEPKLNPDFDTLSPDSSISSSPLISDLEASPTSSISAPSSPERSPITPVRRPKEKKFKKSLRKVKPAKRHSRPGTAVIGEPVVSTTVYIEAVRQNASELDAKSEYSPEELSNFTTTIATEDARNRVGEAIEHIVELLQRFSITNKIDTFTAVVCEPDLLTQADIDEELQLLSNEIRFVSEEKSFFEAAEYFAIPAESLKGNVTETSTNEPSVDKTASKLMNDSKLVDEPVEFTEVDIDVELQRLFNSSAEVKLSDFATAECDSLCDDTTEPSQLTDNTTHAEVVYEPPALTAVEGDDVLPSVSVTFESDAQAEFATKEKLFDEENSTKTDTTNNVVVQPVNVVNVPQIEIDEMMTGVESGFVASSSSTVQHTLATAVASLLPSATVDPEAADNSSTLQVDQGLYVDVLVQNGQLLVQSVPNPQHTEGFAGPSTLTSPVVLDRELLDLIKMSPRMIARNLPDIAMTAVYDRLNSKHDDYTRRMPKKDCKVYSNLDKQLIEVCSTPARILYRSIPISWLTAQFDEWDRDSYDYSQYLQEREENRPFAETEFMDLDEVVTGSVMQAAIEDTIIENPVMEDFSMEDAPMAIAPVGPTPVASFSQAATFSDLGYSFSRWVTSASTERLYGIQRDDAAMADTPLVVFQRGAVKRECA